MHQVASIFALVLVGCAAAVAVQLKASADPANAAESLPVALPDIEVASIVSIPWRYCLKSFELDSKDPTKVETVAINRMDDNPRRRIKPLRHPGFKIVSFLPKHIMMKDGVRKIVPALTVVDNETGQSLFLPLDVVVNYPQSVAVIRLGDGTQKESIIKIGGAFSLPADPGKNYRIQTIDVLEQTKEGKVTSGTVTIETPSGEKVVKPFPAEKK